MTNARFASLHGGMLERGPAKTGYDGGKVAKAHLPLPGPAPTADINQSGAMAPPIRRLLDKVGGWTKLPAKGGADFDAAPARLPAVPALNGPIQPAAPATSSAPTPALHRCPAAAAAPLAGVAEMAKSRPVKPKRRALTLRLAPDSHSRLRHASAETGRTCQDILFAAMNRYLESLHLDK